MQIKYRIIEVQPADQIIIVRFWSDVAPESELASQVDAEGNMLRCRTDMAISLPIPTPTGAALDTLIMRHCPVQFFTMKAAVADAGVDTSLAGIAALIGQEKDLPTMPVVPVNPVPQVVSKYQGCAALAEAGMLDGVEAYFASVSATAEEKLAWRTITEMRRTSPMTLKMAGLLGMTETQVDDLFILAATKIA